MDQQAVAVTELVRRVLGDDLLGAYLHGSAVLGGLTAGSDVDVLAVSRRGLGEDERRALYDGCIAITRSPRTVELTVVVHGEVRPWRFPPRRELQYGDWFRREYVAGRDAGLHPVDDPDLATLLRIVLDDGVPLHGPPPAELLDDVPFADVKRAMLAEIDPWLEQLQRDDERNALLVYSRMWYTLVTEKIVRKDVAARWAAARRPDLELVARAGELYLEGIDGEWDTAAALATARELVAEIRRL